LLPAKNMLSAWTIIAEQLIRAAQDEGKFDNLPGFGKPIPGIDDPYDELWWIKAKLKREQLSVAGPVMLEDPPRRRRR
jgi:DnaJ-like protein